MLTFDSARHAEYVNSLVQRNEQLREMMFGANGIRSMDVLPRPGTRDADALAEFTAQMTEYIDNQLETEDFPGTTFRKIFTLKTDISEGADTYTKHEFSATGEADFLDENADTVPMLSTGIAPTSRNLFPVGQGYRITTREILRATLARVPVSSEKARVAREIVEERLDKIFWAGSTQRGIYGILNHPNIPIASAVTGSWATATADEIKADILTAINSRATATLSVDWQYYLGLPISQYNILTQTEKGAYYDKTLGKWLTDNIPQLAGFFATQRLYLANDEGDADYGIFIPQGSRWGYGLLPGDVKTKGPLERGFFGEDYLTHSYTGGFFTLKPLSFSIIEGI